MSSAFDSLSVPGPIPSALTRPFWEGAAAGQFNLQHCLACERWIFYPRSHCPHCWSTRLSWREASGRGRLKSFSVVHKPGHPAWAAVAPYALGLVELQEGPTMLSTLTGAATDSWRVGMPLKVRFQRIGKFTLPMFTPTEELEQEGAQ